MRDEELLDENEVVFNTEEGVVGEEFTALVEPNKGMFSEKGVQVMNCVADTFRNDTSTGIMNKSHQETAYLKCKDRHIISYEYAKELSLSLNK